MTGADGGSFEAFVARHSAALLRTAYLLTGDRARARDLLQTALMATERRWNQVGDDEQGTAFVRRRLVAAHTSRRRLLRVGDLLADVPLLAGTAGLPGFAQRPADPGPQDEIARGLARLPPDVRAALVLRHGEGLSEAATAELLGRPVEVVATGTARGLELLRTDGPGLGRALAQQARAITTTPEELYVAVRQGARAQRAHRVGLAVLTAVLVSIVLLVAATV